MLSTSRIRLGLYTVVLVALVVAAVVALISLGTHGHGSPAAAVASGPNTSSVSDPVAPPTVAPTSAKKSQPKTATPAPVTKQRPSASKSATPTHATRMAGANHSARAARAPKIYTVKPGDNLTVIAQWFHVRGFQPLYSWNQSVIGRNPNLIFPGQKIIVVPGGSVSVRSRH